MIGIKLKTKDIKQRLEKAKQRALEKAEQVVRNYAVGLSIQFVQPYGNPGASPIGDPLGKISGIPWKSTPPLGYEPGTFISNWQITLNTPATQELDNSGPDNARMEMESLAELGVNNFSLKDKIYIVNTTNYAEDIEKGYSYQAENGVVNVLVDDKSLREFLFQGALDKVKQG